MLIKKVFRYLRRYGLKATILIILLRIANKTEFPVEIREIRQLKTRVDKQLGDRKRVNLLVPSINKGSVFGGATTAISFFIELYNTLGVDARIIAADAYIDEICDVVPDCFEFVDDYRESSSHFQMMSIVDRNDSKLLPVGANDIFIATAWGTAYTLHPVISWQKETFGGKAHPLIYMIQDYEPGFYPWSSKYVLAESTYNHSDDTIAVFNSQELYGFFQKQGYSFKHEHVFNPVLNDKLRDCLLAAKPTTRKKQVIVYGRPSVTRNVFEIIEVSLRLWAQQQTDINKWNILSAGEPHPDVELIAGVKLRSIGKLSLEEYASLMLESYMGISLMVSPHPSYPPLEMSTFGMKTITNTYANKDLSGFNENIISLKSFDTFKISAELLRLASEFPGEAKVAIDTPYVEGAVSGDQFKEICDGIARQLRVDS